MNKIALIISCCIAISISGCTNSCEEPAEGLTEGHTCGRTCSSACKGKHHFDIVGDFDFAMSSVCQASCGVDDFEDAEIVDIIEAKVGDITMCPVSGAIYKVKESSPMLEHDQETFHACCDGCAKKFEEDPERFYKNV